jgi:hypothetical protein
MTAGDSGAVVPVFVGIDRGDSCAGDHVREQLLVRVGASAAAAPTPTPAQLAARLCAELAMPAGYISVLESQIRQGLDRYADAGWLPDEDDEEDQEEEQQQADPLAPRADGGLPQPRLLRLPLRVAEPRRGAHKRRRLVFFIDRPVFDVARPAASPRAYASSAASDLGLDAAWADAIADEVERLVKDARFWVRRSAAASAAAGGSSAAKKRRGGRGGAGSAAAAGEDEDAQRGAEAIRELEVGGAGAPATADDNKNKKSNSKKRGRKEDEEGADLPRLVEEEEQEQDDNEQSLSLLARLRPLRLAAEEEKRRRMLQKKKDAKKKKKEEEEAGEQEQPPPESKMAAPATRKK